MVHDKKQTNHTFSKENAFECHAHTYSIWNYMYFFEYYYKKPLSKPISTYRKMAL